MFTHFEDWKRSRGTRAVRLQPVLFTVEAPEAREVFLCGTFNDWSPTRTPMARDAGGTWRVRLLLPPGTCQYRVRVDGQWRDDPLAVVRVPNGLGTLNCVREVPRYD